MKPTCSGCGTKIGTERELALIIFAGRTHAYHRHCNQQRRHEISQGQRTKQR